MNALCKDNIVDLFVWVDDRLLELGISRRCEVGRPPSLTSSEIATILIWDGLTETRKTMKNLYRYIAREYADCFPNLPTYKNFVMLIHSNLESIALLLLSTLDYSATLRFVDSTMLEVCKYARVNNHKVARGVAKLGANHQGWHYGFKLHASINRDGVLTGVCFTPANAYDAQHMEKTLRGATKIVVGDSHFGARVMTEKLQSKQGIITVAPPHYKQKQKVATKEQIRLLKQRTKIEAVFDYLKEHMNLVTSFPRSIKGYFVHYIRILLGYQMRVLGGVS